MASRQVGNSITFLKRAWHEHPDLVASLAVGVFGMAFTTYTGYRLYQLGDKVTMYKNNYTVIREKDDGNN